MTTMADLDDLQTLAAADTENMIDRIAELPDQVERAWSIVEGLDLPDRLRNASSIVFTGMGGSAIGADFTGAISDVCGTVPAVVWRTYGLPSFVGENSLVIAQ